MNDGRLFAAVDLGSNSFRLEIGALGHGQINRIEYIKEPVRLGAGLAADRQLTEEAMQRGYQCLRRFSERLVGFNSLQVRAVATQTLREARNRDEFVAEGGRILGFPIEVISGAEEARLIYQGVSRLLPSADERRLVVDIGGRSTEVILGQGSVSETAKSFRVGSVSWSLKYFPEGKITREGFEMAKVAAQAVMDEAEALFPFGEWDVVYGSSGTVGAVADVLEAAGFEHGVVDSRGLKWLARALLDSGDALALDLPGLKDERRPVLAGGLAVLMATVELLKIERIQAAAGALRHGVLFELSGPSEAGDDIRDLSVRRLCSAFFTDRRQADRVELVARHFHAQLTNQPASTDSGKWMRKLTWAAQLHEVGACVSYSDLHKHGAYILENADLHGFSAPESHRLALLVLGQRGKLRKLGLNIDDPEFAQALASLRLAVIFCHARRSPDHAQTHFHLVAEKRSFELVVPSQWAAGHPQTSHLLDQEVNAWVRTSWEFSWQTH